MWKDIYSTQLVHLTCEIAARTLHVKWHLQHATRAPNILGSSTYFAHLCLRWRTSVLYKLQDLVWQHTGPLYRIEGSPSEGPLLRVFSRFTHLMMCMSFGKGLRGWGGWDTCGDITSHTRFWYHANSTYMQHCWPVPYINTCGNITSNILGLRDFRPGYDIMQTARICRVGQYHI
jgi:hypothetical protein